MRRFYPLFFISLIFISCELISPVPKGTIYFISIALDYQNTNVNKLYGTINDGREIEKAFRKNSEKTNTNFKSYCFYQIGKDHSHNIINNPLYPTKKHIYEKIKEISKKAKKNDTLIISYSGHGFDKDGSLLLATEDEIRGETIKIDNKISESQFLSPNQLLRSLENLKCKKVLLIDSCFSGFFKTESSNTLDISKAKSNIQKAFEKYFSNSEKRNDEIFILCATEKDNYSHEPSSYFYSHPHGYFSKALLEGLGWSYGEKAHLSNFEIEELIDTDGVQGKLSKGLPPASNGEKTLSLDQLYSFIKRNQEIPTTKQTKIYSHQFPQINQGRKDLVLFSY